MNIIERIQKLNELAGHLLQSGQAKDSVEAQRMAEEQLGAGKEMKSFNDAVNKVGETHTSYRKELDKNGLRQPRDFKDQRSD